MGPGVHVCEYHHSQRVVLEGQKRGGKEILKDWGLERGGGVREGMNNVSQIFLFLTRLFAALY